VCENILYQRAITLEALLGTFGQVLNKCKVSVWLNAVSLNIREKLYFHNLLRRHPVVFYKLNNKENF
jgi:hypothetical protein